MIASVAKIFREGQALKEFEFSNLELSANVFVNAFCGFFIAPRVIRKPHDELVKDVADMFDFLLKAIRVPKTNR